MFDDAETLTQKGSPTFPYLKHLKGTYVNYFIEEMRTVASSLQLVEADAPLRS